MCPIEPPSDPRFDALLSDPHEGPREVLPRLVEGDPLQLIERCAHHLTSEALLLDLERLHARSLALIARHLPEAKVEDVSAWIAERVSEAASQLVDEELYEDRLGFPLSGTVDPRSEFLVGALGIEPAMTREISVSFHRLPIRDRRTFWRAVVSGESLSGITEESGETRDHVIEGLRRVIRSLSLTGLRERDEGSDEFENEGQETS